MENEVVIDGCNVIKCEFFQSEYLEEDSVFCEFCTIWYNACLNNPNCYFKQLQRAKAENERLQTENKELKQKLTWLTIAHKSEQEERTKLELALAKIKVRIINENADDCLLDIKEIIDEVL